MNDKFAYGWESPINVITTSEIIKDFEDGVMCEVKAIVDVDRDELFKALNYDRQQYAQGYSEGYSAGLNAGYIQAVKIVHDALEKGREKNE